MKWIGSNQGVVVRWRRLLCAMIAGLMASCETQPAHEVLSLTDVAPRQVEPGDRIEVLGSGFPMAADIRRITVKLSGHLARPGLAACPSTVQYVLTDPPTGETVVDSSTGSERAATYAESASHQITVDGGGRLSFVATAGLVRELSSCPGERFAPSPDAVPHATVALEGLRGGITVQIETTQGTVLASARALRGPVLDLHFPSPRRLVLELEARAVAEYTLTALGITLAAVQPPDGGLKVDRVRPGSPADEAGIADGDALERIDGATILTVGDFRTAPGARQCVLAVRRGDALDERVLRVDSLAQGVPIDLVATGVLLCVALLVAGLLLTPTQGVIPWLARRLEPALDARASQSVAGVAFRRWTTVVPTDLGRLADPKGWTRPEAVLTLAAAATTLAAATVGPSLNAVASSVDVGLMHAVALAALSLSVALGARSMRSRRTLSVTLNTLGHLAAWQIPAFIALGSTAVSAGSFRMQGLVDAQGSMPWAWLAFRSPITLALLAAYLLGAAAPTGLRATRTNEGTEGIAGRAAGGVATFLFCLIASVVFLGGYRVPGVDRSTQDASTALQMLGASGLIVRTWALVFTVRTMRGALSRLRSAETASLAWRYLLPTAVVGSALVVASTVVGVSVPARAGDVASQVAAWTTLVVCAIVTGWVVWQTRYRRAVGWAPDPFG